MRPRTIEELVGQDQILGPGKPLRVAIEIRELPSLILWGPPGSGKTSLARLFARLAGYHFSPLSAVMAGVRDVRDVTAEAIERRKQAAADGRTLLFLDEIHRFNKAQQDALLPHVEEGTITLVGATTENPSFQVISPLLSRLLVVRLEPPGDEAIRTVVRRSLDDDRGLAGWSVSLEPAAEDFLVNTSQGDARRTLNVLEAAARIAPVGTDGARAVNREALAETLQNPTLYHDVQGDWHYDVVSALIKSLRGSDPDAALYWLARMVEAGEDPLFIARRLVIFAAEDVGNADPGALRLALDVKEAAHFVGLPEGWIPLAQGVVYLATAPKSNASYRAGLRAKEDVRSLGNLPVPLHLRNAPTALAQEMGHGQGYLYPHDHPDAVVNQTYLPDALAGRTYFTPGRFGFEKEIAKRLAWWQRKRREQGSARPGPNSSRGSDL
jgi:putative ATPase